MGQFFESIPPSLIPWIQKQQIFWVASAPLSKDGHVNLSPKCTRGMFHVLDEKRVWYEDMTGSGVETISHIRENGRVTILFTAFEGPPRIARLFGTGTIYEFGTAEYNALIPPETRQPGSRAVIMIDVHKVGTSCGYSIPFFDFKSDRNQLHSWCAKREAFDAAPNSVVDDEQEAKPILSDSIPEKGMRSYWLNQNMHSIDGIPGLATAPMSELAKEREVWGYTSSRTYAPDKYSLDSDPQKGQEKSGLTKNNGGENKSRFGDFIMGIGVGMAVMGVFMRVQGLL